MVVGRGMVDILVVGLVIVVVEGGKGDEVEVEVDVGSTLRLGLKRSLYADDENEVG